MKKIMYALFLLMLVTSCSNYLADEEVENPANEKREIPLTVKVRSLSDGVKIESPLHVFIFNKDGKLIRKNKLSSEETPFKAQLTAGEYTLCAFAGLNEDFYSIPEKIDKNSIIRLPEGKSCPSPIQFGSSTFQLVKESELSIHLSYLVSSLEFKFSNIPNDATKVDVSLTPTSSGFTMNGSCTNDTHVSYTACHNQGEYWTSTPLYILPSQDSKTTLTLSIDRPSGNETLVYTYNSQLQPAQPYRFSGKYNGEISLNGVFEAEGWKPGIDVDFNFSEEGQHKEPGIGENDSQHEGGFDTEDDSGHGNDSDNEGIIVDSTTPTIYCEHLPQAGEFWNDFYIWKSEITSTDEASAILLSKKQWFSILAVNGPAWLEDYSDSNLSNWRVFTKDEARAFYDEYTINSTELNQKLRNHNQDPFYSNNKERYLCENCTYTFNLTGRITIRAAGTKTEYYMRAIKNVRFKINQ